MPAAQTELDYGILVNSGAIALEISKCAFVYRSF